MKILFALSRFPYPLEKGDKLRAFHQIKGLSKKHEVYVFCINESKPKAKHIKHLEKYCKAVYCVEQSKIRAGIKAAWGFFNDKPFQSLFFRSNKAKSLFTEITRQLKPDVIYCQMVRMVENIDFSFDSVYYLDYMDALSLNMERRIEHSNFFERHFVEWEKRKLEKYEVKVQGLFDGFSIISETDQKHIGKLASKPIKIIPNGISSEYFEYYPIRNNTAKEFDLIFTGNMGYHPNVQACKFLINHILPILIKRGYNLKVCLAGARPSKEVRALQSKNVIVTGFVDDLKPFLAKAKLFVAPLFSGSGLQNKLLESMAMGLPTLTTSIANSALKACPKNEIAVLNEAEIMANEIAFLLENELIAEKMGKNGRNYVKNNFSWKTFNDMLSNEFEVLCSSK